jgi:3-phenylpropionate/trans-cinnamate dioxygenase ferredoxin reductase subunit
MNANGMNVTIVGASIGGLRTAESLRRFGYDGSITMIGDESHRPYMRPPLSKGALLDRLADTELALPVDESLNIDWKLSTHITTVDLEERLLRDANGDTHPYSHLVAATGVRARRLVRRTAVDSVFSIRTIDDVVSLREKLRAGQHVVVAGAGVLGCEVAATVRKLGCEVTVVGADELPMQRSLGPGLARRLMDVHIAHGTRFAMGARVSHVEADGDRPALRFSNRDAITADIVVEAAGSLFNTEWLADADVATPHGVRTDMSMRVHRSSGRTWDNVYAVGDLASFPTVLADGDFANVQHWNIPTETARRAAQIISASIAGPKHEEEAIASPFAPLPSFWTDQHEARLMSYGLPAAATSSELLESGEGPDAIYGFFRSGRLTGVCGIGMRVKLGGYRAEIANRLKASA